MNAAPEKPLNRLKTLNLHLRNSPLEIEHLQNSITPTVLILYRSDYVVIIGFTSACVIYITLEVFVAQTLNLRLKSF